MAARAGSLWKASAAVPWRLARPCNVRASTTIAAPKTTCRSAVIRNCRPRAYATASDPPTSDPESKPSSSSSSPSSSSSAAAAAEQTNADLQQPSLSISTEAPPMAKPDDDAGEGTHARNVKLRSYFSERDPETMKRISDMLASPFVPNQRQYASALSTRMSLGDATRLAKVQVAQERLLEEMERKPPTLHGIMTVMKAMSQREVQGPKVEAMRVLLPERLELELPSNKLEYVESATGLVARLRVSADQPNPMRGVILRGKAPLLARAADELIAYDSSIEVYRLGNVSTFDYETHQLWPDLPPEEEVKKLEGGKDAEYPEGNIWIHRDENAVTRTDPYESEPKPEAWTKWTFHEYISKLIEKRLKTDHITKFYPKGTDTDGIRIRLIEETLENPELRHCITPAIFNHALSFIMHRGGHRAAGERLFQSAQDWGIPIDTTTFNIMLGSYARIRATAHFLRILKNMQESYHAPNLRTWLHLLRLVEKDDDRRQIIVSMYDAGAFSDPTARREIAKIMARHDLHIALKQGCSLETFSRQQADQYGEDWFTTAALVQIVKEFLMFYGPGDARFQELGAMFSRKPDDGVVGYARPLLTMLQMAMRRHDWDLALWTLELYTKLGYAETPEVYELLTHLALSTEAPHALGAILVHGFACDKLNWQTQHFMQRVLLGTDRNPMWKYVRLSCFDKKMVRSMQKRKWLEQPYPIVVVGEAVREATEGMLPVERIGAVVAREYRSNDVPWKAEWRQGRGWQGEKTKASLLQAVGEDLMSEEKEMKNEKQDTETAASEASTTSKTTSTTSTQPVTTTATTAPGSDEEGPDKRAKLRPLKLEFRRQMEMGRYLNLRGMQPKRQKSVHQNRRDWDSDRDLDNDEDDGERYLFEETEED